MNEQPSDIEWMIRYLDGELSGEERLHLESRIESDPQLQEVLENIRIARRGLRRYGLQQDLAGIRSGMLREQRRPARLHILPRTLTRIAAVFIIALGILVFYQYSSLTPARLYTSAVQPYTIPVTRAGVDDTSLLSAYTKTNYARVIDLFSKLSHPGPQDYFLTANAWLLTKRPKQAIAAFLSLQELNSRLNIHDFDDDTDYYLAMSYLADGQSGHALPLFEKIDHTPEHLYHDKVGSLFLWKLRHLH